MTVKEGGGRLDWSRSGVIAFDQLGSDMYYDVFTMDPDGGNERCLTCGRPELPNRHIGNPAWHPSNDYLVIQVQKAGAPRNDVSDWFANPGSGINNDLWVMNSAGTRYWQLTDVPLAVGGALHPHFSPAGDRLLWAERVALTGGPIGTWALKVADFSVADGTPRISNIRTYQPGEQKRFYESSSFSTDGRRILFSADLEPGMENSGMDIYTLDLESGALTNLTRTPTEWDEHAQMSPTGSRILWMTSSGVGGVNATTGIKTDFWMMRPDGSGKTQLTFFNEPGHPESIPGGGAASDSSWDPTGTRLMGYILFNLRGDARMVRIDFSSALTAPELPAASVAPRVVSAGETDVHALPDWDATVQRLYADRQLDLIATIPDPLRAGRVHERFAQMHAGVPVYGGHVVRQRDGHRTVSVFGALYADIDVNSTPRLSAAAASVIVVPPGRRERLLAGTPRLLIVPRPDGPAALAYEVRSITAADIHVTHVDAHSGTVLAEHSAVHESSGWVPDRTGDPGDAMSAGPWHTFDLRGNTASTMRLLQRPEAREWLSSYRVSPAHASPSAVAVESGTRLGRSYLASRLGTDVFAASGPPAGIIRPADASTALMLPLVGRGPFYAGALVSIFPDPPGAQGITIGDVVHQVAHAFVEVTSGLFTRGDAARIAEGSADAIASSATGVRLAGPSEIGRAFALTAQAVEADGSATRADIERAFLRAVAWMVPPDATLALARAATLQSARDLELSGTAIEHLRAAWSSAGVN